MRYLYLFFLFGCLHASELSQLQQEIDQTEQKIHALRLKSIGEELQGQEGMRTEWDRYVQKMERAEDYETEVIRLKKELEALQKKKRDLLYKQASGQ